MKEVILYGNRSAARGMYFDLQSFTDYKVVAFTVDQEFIEEKEILGLPVVPFETIEENFPPENHAMFIAVGYVANNRVRSTKFLASRAMGYEIINFVSPTATIYPGTTIGANCYIGHYAVIAANASIGENVFVGTLSTIGHDTILGDHCFLSEGVSIAGYVTVGEATFLGLRSVIRNNITIGSECVVGAGAIMLEDASNRSVYLGEPASRLAISSDQLGMK